MTSWAVSSNLCDAGIISYAPHGDRADTGTDVENGCSAESTVLLCLGRTGTNPEPLPGSIRRRPTSHRSGHGLVETDRHDTSGRVVPVDLEFTTQLCDGPADEPESDPLAVFELGFGSGG